VDCDPILSSDDIKVSWTTLSQVIKCLLLRYEQQQGTYFTVSRRTSSSFAVWYKVVI
jgi:hypothetical protein